MEGLQGEAGENLAISLWPPCHPCQSPGPSMACQSVLRAPVWVRTAFTVRICGRPNGLMGAISTVKPPGI
jgi:hypothetical protein